MFVCVLEMYVLCLCVWEKYYCIVLLCLCMAGRYITVCICFSLILHTKVVL